MYIRHILVLGAALAVGADRADVNRYRTPMLPDGPDVNSLPSGSGATGFVRPSHLYLCCPAIDEQTDGAAATVAVGNCPLRLGRICKGRRADSGGQKGL